MEIKESIEILECIESPDLRQEEYESIKSAIHAMKKQIEKKPKYYGEDDDYTIECPCCQSSLNDIEECGISFCPDCGQRLDWSE